MKLTPKQKKFADSYIDTGNGTRSALEAYDTDDYSTAASIASENLKKPELMAYFEEISETVAANMYKLALSAESENVQYSAGKDLLDRAGYKPVDKKDVTSGGKPLIMDSTVLEKYEVLDDNEE